MTFKQCPEVISHARKTWGVTTEGIKSGWLLSDGTMLDMSTGGSIRQIQHDNIKFIFDDAIGYIPTNPITTFMCECNAIRFHQSPYYEDEAYLMADLDVCSDPTEAQFKKLKEIMEDYHDSEVIWDIILHVDGPERRIKTGHSGTGNARRDIGKLRKEFRLLKEKYGEGRL